MIRLLMWRCFRWPNILWIQYPGIPLLPRVCFVLPGDVLPVVGCVVWDWVLKNVLRDICLMSAAVACKKWGLSVWSIPTQSCSRLPSPPLPFPNYNSLILANFSRFRVIARYIIQNSVNHTVTLWLICFICRKSVQNAYCFVVVGVSCRPERPGSQRQGQVEVSETEASKGFWVSSLSHKLTNCIISVHYLHRRICYIFVRDYILIAKLINNLGLKSRCCSE